MIATGRAIRLIVAAMGKIGVESIVEAAKTEGWDVSTIDSPEQLYKTVHSASFDAILIAADTPQALPAKPVHELLGNGLEVPVFFLFPPGVDITESQANLGATSDQLWDTNMPLMPLIEAIRNEIHCAMDNRPDYTMICVDDDPEFLTSLRELLLPGLKKAFRRLRLNVQFFVQPLEALAQVRSLEAPLALSICDQVMPDMQGLDLLEKITELCPDTQRVLLTGYAGQDSAIRAVNDKLLDKYLTKPITEPVDFINTIRHLIEKCHLQRVSADHRRRLMAQFEFIRTVTSAASVEKVLDITTRFLLRQLCAPWTAVLLRDTDRIVLGATAGQPPDLASEAYQAFITDLGRQAVELKSPSLIQQDKITSQNDPTAPLSVIAAPLRSGKEVLGIILAANNPPGRMFSRDARLLTSFVVDVTGITLGRFNDAEALESYYIGTMASLMDIVEAKDPYTRGHTERVAELAVALGKAVSMSDAQLRTLHHAAALHDLGKLAVPEEILRNPGSLSPSDYAIVKQHPGRADMILSHLRHLDSARMIIRSHHERYDGTGYPDGLTGEEIPLGGRILAIADSYDAMTSSRSYRDAMNPAEALAKIQAGASTQFDPALATTFVKIIEHRKSTDGTSDENQWALTEAKRS